MLLRELVLEDLRGNVDRDCLGGVAEFPGAGRQPALLLRIPFFFGGLGYAGGQALDEVLAGRPPAPTLTPRAKTSWPCPAPSADAEGDHMPT